MSPRRPACVADLRAPVLDCIFVTDASDSKVAAVQAAVPSKVAEESWRYSLKKGCWARFLPKPPAWLRARSLLDSDHELHGDESLTPHPLWQLLARSLSYVHVFCGDARRAHQRHQGAGCIPPP